MLTGWAKRFFIKKDKCKSIVDQIIVGVIVGIIVGVISRVFDLVFMNSTLSVLDFSMIIFAVILISRSVLIHWISRDGKKCKKRGRYYIPLILGIVLLIIVVLMHTVFICDHNTQENPIRPTVKIISPLNGSYVNMNEQVLGISANIPKDSKVWIVLYEEKVDRYYPQPLPIDKDGDWTCAAQFGGENDDGEPFVIIAVVADEAAIKLFENDGGRGLIVFPPSQGTVEEYDRITVFRKTYTTPTPTPTIVPMPTSTPMPTIAPTPTPAAEPVITITSPVSNANVTMWEWVSGTSKNIPIGQELWVVVKVDGLYFPHRVETLNADGAWRHNVQIGQKDEGGKLFELIAVFTDSSAQKELKEWYKNQDDLYDLPSGTTRYSTVTVTRSVEKFVEPFVTIRSLSNADKVDICEWVSGTAQNIPYGYQLWVVVRWESLYFPMYDGVKINTDGSWTYNTTIGQTYDGGRNFEIIAVLADGSAQAMINEWHQNPYDLYRLFPGMTPYNSVTVTRK